MNNLEALFKTRFNVITNSINELKQYYKNCKQILLCFSFIHTSRYKTDLRMTYKRMLYSVSIDQRKAYYKAYYQQNEDRYKQRYT